MVQQNTEGVRRIVRRHLGFRLRLRMDSDDMLQEALAEATRLVGEGCAPLAGSADDFLNWLEAVIGNKARNLARFHDAQCRTPRREERLETEQGARLCTAAKTPSGVAITAEVTARVRTAIESLPPRQREVVTLVHLEKRSVPEVARSMGKTENATSVLLSLALRKLRAILQRMQE
jgi:RNA polymerase sigma factor (sigma-70 family)